MAAAFARKAPKRIVISATAHRRPRATALMSPSSTASFATPKGVDRRDKPGHDAAGCRKVPQNPWIGTAIANLSAHAGARRRREDGVRAMSTFDNPFDPERRLNRGCVCGRHGSQAEHDDEA